MRLRRVTKSCETSGSSMYSTTPFIGPSEASLTALQISSQVASFLSLAVRSTTETLVVGTLKAIPVSLPLSSGITLPTALAAPVDDGITLQPAALPALQSFPPFDGPSTVSWFMVTAWTVVMSPSSIPHLSLRTLVIGARQLVVQEALETTFMSGV